MLWGLRRLWGEKDIQALIDRDCYFPVSSAVHLQECLESTARGFVVDFGVHSAQSISMEVPKVGTQR